MSSGVLLPIILITVLLSNIIFYVAGGYLSLFRTAYNDDLKAESKLRWMVAQTFFPLSSIAYLLILEKNFIIRVAGCLALLLACGGVGFGVVHMPWNKAADFVAGMKLGIEQAAQQKADKGRENRKNVPNKDVVKRMIEKQQQAAQPSRARLNDELSKKAETLSSQMFTTFNAAQTQSDKDILNKADIALSHIRWEYVYDDMPPDEYTSLLQDLETIATNRSPSSDQEEQWEARVTNAIAKNQSRKLTHQ